MHRTAGDNDIAGCYICSAIEGGQVISKYGYKQYNGVSYIILVVIVEEYKGL